VDVYWNGGLDKQSITVPASASDTVLVEEFIPNMGEQSYSFDVRTIDGYGHQSLKTTGSGASYGDFFRSNLLQRRINGVSINEKLSQVQITWGVAAENLERTEIRYTAVDNETKVIKVKPDESLTSIADAADGSPFEYRSLFLPEPTAIDTFAMEWESTIAPVVFFDRTTWVVLQVSDERADDGGGKATLIDDNRSTYWHSMWGPNIPPPHWAIIDMQNSLRNITRIETWRRANNGNSKTVQYFVSDDPDPDAATWVQIGSDVVFPNNSSAADNMRTTEIPSPDPANKKRYLKIYLPDSNNNQNTSIAEIYVYGSY
jgi:hypothetical protein